MNSIRFFGMGKLGLPLAALFAEAGVQVEGVDISQQHVAALSEHTFTSDEPELNQLLHAAGDRLVVTTSPSALPVACSIIHVPTPSDAAHPAFAHGAVVSAIKDAAAAVARSNTTGRHLIVIASTVMPGTFDGILLPLAQTLSQQHGLQFDLGYVPDFVAIGQVIAGFRKPQALLLGAGDSQVFDQMRKLYGNILQADVPVVGLTLAEAEIAKVALNFFLCMKIDFANWVSRLCAISGGADSRQVLQAIGLDSRVGNKFLKPGMPFGGPCFPRDVVAMEHFARSKGDAALLAGAVAGGNVAQLQFLVDDITSGTVKTVAIVGLAFKAGTSVITDSPSVWLAEALVQRNIAVQVFDVSEKALDVFASTASTPLVTVCDSLASACLGADVVVVAVEDPAYCAVTEIMQPGVRVLDPWGFL